MPVTCPIAFPRISDDEMRSIDYAVMAQAFAVHNELGRLADESVYQHKLLQLLCSAGMEARTEVPIQLSFRDFSIPLSMDLVVGGKAIYELKTAAALLPSHESQLIGYLFLTNATHGKLVNFRTQSVESKFVNTKLTTDGRRRFETDTTCYCGDDMLVDLVRELVADWGTGLSAALYRRAVLHSYRGEEVTEKMLPMSSAGQSIGNQRFHLLSDDTALGVTTFGEVKYDNKIAFDKLLAASPLRRFHWLNITHGQVTVSTIAKE
jgi:GxxExxY protein